MGEVHLQRRDRHREALEHFPGVSPPGQLFLPAEAFDALRRERPGADWIGTVETAGGLSRFATPRVEVRAAAHAR